jgi:hypothetical protein
MTSPTSRNSRSLDVGGLLTIDVASELRKICESQIEAPWQLPAELVRRAFRAGARSVAVSFGRHRVVVADDGRGLDPDLAERVAVLVDPRRDPEARHRALVALEGAREPALLALGSLTKLQELIIEMVHGRESYTVALRRGSKSGPSLAVGPAPTSSGSRIELRTAEIDRQKAAAWLFEIARFAPSSLVVDGRPGPDGMDARLAEVPLCSPLRGRLALLERGETAHAYLLAHGLVTAHMTIPGVPSFLAAVELGSADEDPAPNRLRDALVPLIPSLVQQAVGLIVATGHKLSVQACPESLRSRLAHLVLQAARSARSTDEIQRVAVFRTLVRRTSGRPEVRLVDLASLREYAAANEGASTLTSTSTLVTLPTLVALPPSQRPDRYALGAGPVLVADGAERSMLAEVLGVRFQAPSGRTPSGSLLALVRRGVRYCWRALTVGGARLLHPAGGTLLRDDQLTPGEQALLVSIREHLGRASKVASTGGAVDAVMCEGQAAPRRVNGKMPMLVLSRNNAIVAACVRAIATDPGLTWLTCLALVAGTPRAEGSAPR